MASYTIVGPLPVVNREPGSTVTDDDLAGLDVAFLIEVGHIAPNTPKASKADTVNKED